MKIAKVINNNVISVIENGKELVVMGRGIAFQKRSGDEVDETRIEKVFKLDNKDLISKFKELLYEVPTEYIRITEEIIKYAKEELNKKLNDIIYISLTDHIHFAIERYRQGIQIVNPLIWEIKRIYKDEFRIGKKALQMIQQYFHLDLPEDEAGFIAMHIVNAELNEKMGDVAAMTKMIQDILTIVKYHFKIQLDEESLNYFRFLTHLKFFIHRLMNKNLLNHEEYDLHELVKQKYREAYKCTEKIAEYIQKTHGCTLTPEEEIYLTIHIERVTNRK
ncbi:beta-glucoside operon transcriptional antiterminator [Anoxybacillus voinovskiensis]|uniref:Beta-glucoside operon transcriptional antiterminator n=1 Tax=Anoxybacteroides voinovskiense TaxID=230470 RepID=A0A840DMV9_9BACL|nr:PRD domain-containing protein [Anoxybacillus voinovskiensis]MBB4074270.1 beta-glucoside operon transcriptional antiterminator [Anoxybacillus voinovskiensis]GGJ69112.1 transcription antiterminator LicT [Anoxybacillus voinovskiensis]